MACSKCGGKYILVKGVLQCSDCGCRAPYQPVQTKAQLVAENEQLKKRIEEIKKHSVYIEKGVWQSDLPILAAKVRSPGTSGLLCFIPDEPTQNRNLTA